jgi:hypothetical protein
MDLNKEVAEKVMGWKIHHPKPEPGDHFSSRGDWFKYGEVKSYYNPGGLNVDQWNPLKDLNQCFQVVEKLRKNHCCITIYSDHDYIWRIELIKKTCDPIANHKPYVVVDGEENLNEAILKAALTDVPK